MGAANTTTEGTPDDSIPKMVRLSKPERRLALRAYKLWLLRADKNPLMRRLPRERVALSSAYGAVACAWLVVVIPLTYLGGVIVKRGWTSGIWSGCRYSGGSGFLSRLPVVEDVPRGVPCPAPKPNHGMISRWTGWRWREQ